MFCNTEKLLISIRAFGLVVWFSLWVREVPSSILGTPLLHFLSCSVCKRLISSFHQKWSYYVFSFFGTIITFFFIDRVCEYPAKTCNYIENNGNLDIHHTLHNQVWMSRKCTQTNEQYIYGEDKMNKHKHQRFSKYNYMLFEEYFPRRIAFIWKQEKVKLRLCQ